MILKGHILGLNTASRKLLILLLTIAACLIPALYISFVKGADIIFYTHFFYIPIILAGVWYQKKAVYVALLFGLVYVVATYLSPLPLSLSTLGIAGIFIGVAYGTGLVSQKSAEEETLRRRSKQIIHYQTTLLKLTKIDYSDLDLVLEKITETDTQTLGVAMVSVWLFNKDRSEIVCECCYRLSKNIHDGGLRLLASKKHPRYFQALEDSRVLAATDARTDPRTRELAAYLESLDITSIMDVPLRLHGKIVGIVCHEHVGPEREWTAEEQDFAASIADVVSLALETSQCKQAEVAMGSSFIQLAETVSRAMETQDPYTAGHQRRVAELSRQVGEKMGLDEEELRGIYIAGLLHDVGKISIPVVILTYPGKLGEAEWALIHSHPRCGYEILKEVQFPWPVAKMALHHQERLDGSGYPDGLKGNELSREVRILSACDVVEAMSSARPYRPARTREEVQEELLRGKETKYDPQVVDILLNLLNENQTYYSKFFRGTNPIVTK